MQEFRSGCEGSLVAMKIATSIEESPIGIRSK
jgi:hypothetical protein